VARNARDGSALPATGTPAITASCPHARPAGPPAGGPTSRLEVFAYNCSRVHTSLARLGVMLGVS